MEANQTTMVFSLGMMSGIILCLIILFIGLGIRNFLSNIVQEIKKNEELK